MLRIFHNITDFPLFFILFLNAALEIIRDFLKSSRLQTFEW